MIEVRNLVKEFSVDQKSFKALDQVNFKVEKGEIYGIIGLSGAGKSTLVRCINRLEMPDSGSILIEGSDILKMNDKDLANQRKDIAMIFQSFNLFNQKTVAKNIAYPMEIAGFDPKEIDARVEMLLGFIDLKDKKNEYPSRLSGGQKQRVAIARALATKPKILLSDEATSALDPANTQMILDILRKAVEEFNLTVIMITHQMEVAKDICTRIAVMENGQIVEENQVEDLFKNPKHRVTKSFIKSLKDETEEEIYKRENFKGRLFNLNFDDRSARVPIVSQVIKETGVDINILSGNINKLQTTSVGYLTIEILGSLDQVEAAIDLFAKKQVRLEEL